MGKRGLLRLVLQGGAELKTPLKNDNDFDRVIKLLELEREYMKGRKPEPTTRQKMVKRYNEHFAAVPEDEDDFVGDKNGIGAVFTDF